MQWTTLSNLVQTKIQAIELLFNNHTETDTETIRPL